MARIRNGRAGNGAHASRHVEEKMLSSAHGPFPLKAPLPWRRGLCLPAAAMSHRDYLTAFPRLLATWTGRKSGREGDLTGCQKPGGCQGNGENIPHVKPTFLTSRPPSRMSAELNPPGRLKVR